MMQSENVGETLIAHFFTALERRYLEQCGSVLEQLQAYAAHEPMYAAWCVYFAGILANERDNDWAKAERLFLQALHDPPELRLQLRILYALGRTYDYQGRWNEAITTFEQHLAIATRLGQPVEQSKAWKHLAISYQNGFSQGMFRVDVLHQAIGYCREALAAIDTAITTPSTRWIEGSIWNTLGALYMNLRQWDAAIEAYHRDQYICRELGDENGLGISALNLGEIYHARGSGGWPMALACYNDALQRFQHYHNQYHEADVLANLAHLSDQMGQGDQALDYYLQAISLIETLRASVSSETGRAGFFATVIDTYANAILLCLRLGRHAEAFEYTERARSRTFLDLLAARSPALSSSAMIPTVTLAEVQTALASDELLISYFTTGLVEVYDGPATERHAQRHRFPPARIVIMAITSDAMMVCDAGIAPNDLLPRRLDNPVESHFLQPSTRRTLYDKLVAPVANLLQGRRRLYFIPHGPLHYIPFQALIDPDGNTLLHENGPEFVYTPSATFLLHTRHASDIPATSACLSLGYNGPEHMRLRFAEAEARSVGRLMAGVTLAGSMDKKQILYQSAMRHRLLHISCHGDFNPDSPLDSPLYLAPDELLTAQDVFESLRLRCDLVTLSACMSGLSRVRRGDELIGLARAFMYAGARAVIATLWPVDEQSTWLLMERLYVEIRNGVPIAAALHRAQLFLMNLTRREVHERLIESGELPLFEMLLPIQRSKTGASLENITTPLTRSESDHIFADPYYWAPFILVAAYSSDEPTMS